MTTDIPRTLVLTLWPPDARYKILYKNVAYLPTNRVICATLQACRGTALMSWPHRAFIPKRLHWRLNSTAMGHWYMHEAQSARLAEAIANWTRPLEPEVLWVLPELGAASVGWHLKRLLHLPMHITVHDAHETARHIVPPLYYPIYAHSVRRCLRAADSLDVISGGMEHYLKANSLLRPQVPSFVFPPSMLPAIVAPEAGPLIWDSRVRRIGLCGSMRVTSSQWERFVKLLGRLPYTVEILAFAYEDLFPQASLPANVTIHRLPFVETEEGIIREFRRLGVHACYLGLFREPDRALFGRTSLSAKLATYAAMSLPILVDSREDASAWQLVSDFCAGVRVDEDDDVAVKGLMALCDDRMAWTRMAAGSGRLCREAMNLETNMERLGEALRALASH